MTDELVLWINIIEDSIGVGLVTSREHYDLEILSRLLEALYDIWTDIDSRVNCLILGFKIYLKHNVRLLRLYIVDAVNQCLVHIEYAQLLLVLVSRWRQIDDQIVHFVFLNDADAVPNSLERADRLLEVVLVQVTAIWVLLLHFGDHATEAAAPTSSILHVLVRELIDITAVAIAFLIRLFLITWRLLQLVLTRLHPRDIILSHLHQPIGSVGRAFVFTDRRVLHLQRIALSRLNLAVCAGTHQLVHLDRRHLDVTVRRSRIRPRVATEFVVLGRVWLIGISRSKLLGCQVLQRFSASH